MRGSQGIPFQRHQQKHLPVASRVPFMLGCSTAFIGKQVIFESLVHYWTWVRFSAPQGKAAGGAFATRGEKRSPTFVGRPGYYATLFAG